MSATGFLRNDSECADIPNPRLAAAIQRTGEPLEGEICQRVAQRGRLLQSLGSVRLDQLIHLRQQSWIAYPGKDINSKRHPRS